MRGTASISAQQRKLEIDGYTGMVSRRDSISFLDCFRSRHVAVPALLRGSTVVTVISIESQSGTADDMRGARIAARIRYLMSDGQY